MPAVLGVFNGLIFSIMNVFNAQLSQVYGNTFAIVLIHIIGIIFAIPLTIRHIWGKPKAPAWMYIGGLLGIITVFTSNLGITTVGVTATLALQLLGQLVASTVIDQTGLFGFQKVRFRKEKVLSIALIALGVVVMIVW